MSALAGVVYFDERPVPPTIPTHLHAALAPFGPDASGDFIAPGLAMVFRGLHVTPEETEERQPVVSRNGNVLTWDGRLDNREDLSMMLRREQLADDVSDAALVMAAYQRWGADAFAILIGDWSLAIWNTAERSLLLASDYLGNRPLFYLEQHDSLWWSSTLSALLTVADVSQDIDPCFAVGYLTFALPPGATPYAAIKSVPAAHVLSRSLRTPTGLRRYWDYPDCRIRYATDDDYASHLRHLFKDAVRSRLRSTRPVWFELSGGLDSSSLVCMADWLARHDSVSSQFNTISYVSDTSPEADERRFIEAVLSHIHCASTFLRLEDYLDSHDTERSWITPLHPGGTALATFEAVRAKGGRVLLSGNPGDLVMGNIQNNSSAVLDAISSRQILQTLALLRRWSLATQNTIWAVGKEVAIEALSFARASRSRLRMALQERGANASATLPEALCQAYILGDDAVTVWLRQLAGHVDRVPEHTRLGARRLVNGVIQYANGRLLQTPSEFCGLHYTHPYTHRPLVQFMASLPVERLARPGEPRWQMKAAFNGLLPQKVNERFSKGYIAPFKLRRMRRLVPVLLTQVRRLEVVKQGFVDPTLLEKRLMAVRDRSARSIGNLENIVRLEAWLAARATQKCARQAICT